MRRIALVTDRERPRLTHDDRWVLPALASKGLEAVPAVWDDPAVPWAEFDAAWIRSPWDYHRRFEAFSEWLDRVEVDTRVFNPPSVVRWNARKQYLGELGAQGIPIIPTVRGIGSELRLSELSDAHGWPEIVVKPEVSGGGTRTWRLGSDEFDRVQAEIGRSSETWLVQPFLPVVQSEGEWSLVYFDGEFSHAVRKVPARGQWLVHEEHGGRLLAGEPSPEQLALGERVLGLVAPMAYARVDVLRDGDLWRLVELEVIEPELFFRFSPPSTERFAAAVARRVSD